MIQECPNAAVGVKNCPCTYACPRRGKCCECVAHHCVNAELPACYFTPEEEKLYDRSIAFYLSRKKG